MLGRWTRANDPIRSFSADLSHHTAVGQRYVGTVTVPVDRIVGSVGRAHELRSDFLPLRKRFGFSRETARHRWVKKAMAQSAGFDLADMHRVTGRYHSHADYDAKRGATLPPVELYKLGNIYYVVDGHHRVAAARSLGQLEMEAVVTDYIPAPAADSHLEAAQASRIKWKTRQLSSWSPGWSRLPNKQSEAFDFLSTTAVPFFESKRARGDQPMTTEATPIDMSTLNSVVGAVLSDHNAAVASALIYLGDRNGLFTALAGAGAVTPEELAAKTGQSARYLREWLSAMVCSGYVEYDPATERFTLPPEQAFCLANPDSPVFLAGLFEMLPTWYENASKVADVFKSGTGVLQNEYGEEFWRGFERFTRAQFLNHLVQDWIAGIERLDARLQTGARVADVGCGNGQACLILARAYPNSSFVGFDDYPLAIHNARRRLAATDLKDRVRYELHDVVDGLSGTYDLITVLDTVHDMVNPVGALTRIREALNPDGVLLWTEFNVSGDLAENLTHPLNLAKATYSFSTLYCMTTSLAEGGAGIGTCMGQHKAEDLAREAGFTSFRRLPLEDPITAVYEVRASS